MLRHPARRGVAAPRPTRLALLLALLALAGGSACYRYVPEGAAAPGVAEGQVQVHLTPDGTTALTSVLGPGAVAIRGEMRERQADGTLELGVESVLAADGQSTPWAGDASLRVPPAYVESVDVRRLSKGRTALAVVAATAGAVALGVKATHRGTADSGDRGNPPPPGLRAPVVP